MPTEQDRAFVRLDGVSRVYGSGSTHVPALKDVTLQIGRGERVALLGRSGSGKSTLLNLLGGLDRATSGSISVNNSCLNDMSSNQLAAYRLSSVGMVYQEFHLIPSRTALENVELPFTLSGVNRQPRRAAATEALAAVGLADRASHLPSELSGGEQQRVAIARAFANQPSLLLADEPTGNLDSETAADVQRLMLEYCEQVEATVLLVTHDEELASAFAQRTLRLHDGRLEEPS